MNKVRELLKIISVLMFSILIVGCSTNPQSKIAEEEIRDEMAIETSCGNLYFPSEWEDFLKIDQKEEDTTVSVSFSAEISNEIFPLFTIVIGDDEGEPAGELSDHDGTKQNIYVHIEEISASESLSESEQKRLYVMQEDINYLLDRLE